METIFKKRIFLLSPILLSAIFLFLTNQVQAYVNPSVNPTGGIGSIYIEPSTPANALYLKSNGNVGIGITDPDNGFTNAKRITKTSGLVPALILTDTTVSGREWAIFSGSPALGYFKIRDNTASADRLVIDTSGNIGIGKGNPATALDVNGTVTATAFAGPLSGTLSAANVSSGNFGANTGGGNYTYPANVGFGSTVTPIAKIHISDAANAAMEIDEYGSAGNWIRFRTALGTQAAPTAVTNGTSIGGLSISGHDGTGMAGMSTGLQAIATENWTSAAHGSALALYSTPNATTGNYERLRIDQNGNIGIGISTPGAKLDVYQSGTFNATTPGTAKYGIHLTPIDTVVDKAVGITFGAGDTSTGTTAQAGIYSQYSGAYGTKLYFATTDSYAAGAKTRMMINASGNIGIGTTNPVDKVHINGSDNRSVSFAVGTTNQRINFRESDNGNSNLAYAAIGSTLLNGSTGYAAGNLNFYTTPGVLNATPIERMTIDSAGNVGVGTTAPAATLDVNGTTRLQKTSVGGSTTERFYPDIVSAAQDGNVNGAWIINTPIPRASNIMFRIRVHGYAYGTPDSIDFTIVGYPYSGTTGSIDGVAGGVINYKLQDNGTDSWSKYVGVNSAGNVAIAFGDTGSSIYFQRLSVDAWITRTATDYSSSTWSITQDTTSNFSFKDIHGPLVSYNNTCALVSYTGGTTACPAGYYTWSGTALASGYMLCCRVRNPI